MLAIMLAGTACTNSKSTASSGSGTSTKPNILYVMTDDMTLELLQYMPQVRQLIGDQGVSFDDYFDNVTLCCPARTSILRGQYAHNTGVLTNAGTNGGFETAHSKHVEDSTIATAMHSAGYTTGLFGKYLNGYPNGVSPSFVPPGWDQWSSSSKGDAYGEFNYTLNENGKQVDYGHRPSDYGTDVYVSQTKDFMDRAAKASKPFFAYLAVYAPHFPATPAPQDAKSFPGLQAPRDPSFNEADVSDKPQWVKSLPLLGPPKIQGIDGFYRHEVQSLQAVDRGVVSLIDQLRADHQLDNTYIVFTSDNGLHLGQHRLENGKQTAYETDIHLPLLVRGPGIPAGTHTSAIAGNVDLAPTIADLGGAVMTDNPDGRSLVPLLKQPTATSPNWRNVYLLEHWQEVDTGSEPGGDAELEPADPDQADAPTASNSSAPTTSIRRGAAAGNKIPEYFGLRTARYAYVEYSTGERELYDITKDPSEVNNLAASADPALLATLHQRLDSMRACSADTCRANESAPLDLPG